MRDREDERGCRCEVAVEIGVETMGDGEQVLQQILQTLEVENEKGLENPPPPSLPHHFPIGRFRSPSFTNAHGASRLPSVDLFTGDLLWDATGLRH